MGIRSIQIFALGLLLIATTAVAIQTTPSSAAHLCSPSVAPPDGSLELAALFAPDAEFADAKLFGNAPFLIYAANDVAFESQGAALVRVSDVTNCAHHGNII